MECTYFDIDDILATHQRLTVQFEVAVPDLGPIVNLQSQDVPKETKLELPFWLAFALGHREKPIAKIEIPKHYQEKYRTIMEADAEVVDLNKFGPYYYDFGMWLLRFAPTEAELMNRLLIDMFVLRYRWLMDGALNASSDLRQHRLDRRELSLFKIGQAAVKEFEAYRLGECSQLAPSNLIACSKKRKSADS